MMCSASMWRRFCKMNALSRCGTSWYDVNWRTPARIIEASNLPMRAGVSYTPHRQSIPFGYMICTRLHTKPVQVKHDCFRHNPGKHVTRQQVARARTWCQDRPWASSTGG